MPQSSTSNGFYGNNSNPSIRAYGCRNDSSDSRNRMCDPTSKPRNLTQIPTISRVWPPLMHYDPETARFLNTFKFYENSLSIDNTASNFDYTDKRMENLEHPHSTNSYKKSTSYNHNASKVEEREKAIRHACGMANLSESDSEPDEDDDSVVPQAGVDQSSFIPPSSTQWLSFKCVPTSQKIKIIKLANREQNNNSGGGSFRQGGRNRGGRGGNGRGGRRNQNY